MSADVPRASVRTWLAGALPREVRGPLDLLARTPGVARVVVLPDVHFADGVCVGVVTGATDRVFPDAVGRDIGCGMAAEAFDVPAAPLREPSVARRILDGLGRAVPPVRRGGPALRVALPSPLDPDALSAPSLATVAARDGRVEFGTLGRGNHFLELQADADDRLWVMVHSGSRAVGPAIHAFHHARARRADVGLPGLPADGDDGRAYLADLAWALAYAEASRAAMLDATAGVLADVLGARPVPGSRFGCLHNHVRRETHAGEVLLVHRKGAVSAAAGERGIVPGSMGTWSFHTEGRGAADAMASCSHGAGRVLSRGEARRRVSVATLRREMGDVAFDARRARDLVEEAPSAYREIGAVLRAQADLVRVVRRLRPVLVHKGT